MAVGIDATRSYVNDHREFWDLAWTKLYQASLPYEFIEKETNTVARTAFIRVYKQVFLEWISLIGGKPIEDCKDDAQAIFGEIINWTKEAKPADLDKLIRYALLFLKELLD